MIKSVPSYFGDETADLQVQQEHPGEGGDQAEELHGGQEGAKGLENLHETINDKG